MNEEKIFDMISLADDEYVLDASHKKRTIRLGKHAVSMLAAALICTVLLACVAAAVVVTNIVHKGSLNDFYESSTVSEMESRGYTVGKSVENGHARLTLDSVMSDNFRCHPVFTLEALDDETDDYFKRQFSEPEPDTPHNVEYLVCKLCYADNGELIYDNIGLMWYRYYGKDKSVTLRADILYSRDGVWIGDERKNIVIDRSRKLKLSVEIIYADNISDLHLLDGLETELPHSEPVKYVRLYSQSGEQAYISELGIAVPRTYGDQTPWLYTIKWKDGSVTKEYETGSSGGIYNTIGKEMCLIDFRRLIDPDNIESIELFGTTYTRRE